MLALLIDRDRRADSLLTPRHFHDFGKLLLAFVMLWAYLSFSQFLIIWSGNLPEEIPWYLARIRGSWGAVAIAAGRRTLLRCRSRCCCRAISRSAAALLAKVAIFILVMRLIDLIWSRVAFRHIPEEPRRQLPDALDGHRDSGRADGPVGVPVRASAAQPRRCSRMNDPYLKEAFAHEAH